MKKIMRILCAAAAALSLTACGGNISSVRVNIGPSEVYSAAEISDAVDMVQSHFRKEFDGCTLTEVSYSEESSKKAEAEWTEQYDADQAIVLTSSFEVTGKSDGSLAEGETYRNWQWILVRNDGGNWQLKTWGY